MSPDPTALRSVPNVGALALKVHANPTQDEFRKLALAHTPNMRRTSKGSMNKVASIAKARSAGNTYVIAEDASLHTCKTMKPADAQKYIEAQEAYIAGKEMIRLDGYIGNHPETRVRARCGCRWRARTSPRCSRSSTSRRIRPSWRTGSRSSRSSTRRAARPRARRRTASSSSTSIAT